MRLLELDRPHSTLCHVLNLFRHWERKGLYGLDAQGLGLVMVSEHSLPVVERLALAGKETELGQRKKCHSFVGANRVWLKFEESRDTNPTLKTSGGVHTKVDCKWFRI